MKEIRQIFYVRNEPDFFDKFEDMKIIKQTLRNSLFDISNNDIISTEITSSFHSVDKHGWGYREL